MITLLSAYHTTRLADVDAVDHILTKHMVQTALDDLLALLSAQPVPDGERIYSLSEVDILLKAAYPSVPVAGEWVLVPREPTEAMLRATTPYRKGVGETAERIYRAMLSASPGKPQDGDLLADSQTSGGDLPTSMNGDLSIWTDLKP